MPLSIIARASGRVGRCHNGNTGVMPVPASFCSRYALMSCEEQIAEDDVGDALPHGARDSFSHSRLVNVVRTGIGDRHDARRQSGGLELRQQDFLPHAVDRHPIEGLGHRRQCADNIEFTADA